MLNDSQARRLVPWAWLCAWMLTGAGAALSDIYSSPSQKLTAYFVLSALGWGAAGYLTARAASAPGMAARLAAWGVAYLVAVPLGLAWMLSRDLIPYLLFVPYGLAGAIGGVVSSQRSGVWKLASGLAVGLAFFLFGTVIVFAAYVLLALSAGPAALVGWVGANVLAWALPGAVCGGGAGLAARWLLGMRGEAAPQMPMQSS